MNEKQARFARLVAREVQGRPEDMPPAGARDAYHRMEAVKRHFDSKSHRERGKLSRIWRSVFAGSLKKRGVGLRIERKRAVKLHQEQEHLNLRPLFRSLSRSKRNQVARVVRGNNECWPPEVEAALEKWAHE